MRASRAACSSSWRRCSSDASMRARTSLASLPTRGRSSGSSWPIWRSTPVSEPFLPVTATRMRSSSARSPTPPMPLAASLSMALRSSMIVIPTCPFPSRAHMPGVGASPVTATKKPPLLACASKGGAYPRYHLAWPPDVCPAYPLFSPFRGAYGLPTCAPRAYVKLAAGGVNSGRLPWRDLSAGGSHLSSAGNATAKPLRHSLAA